MARFVAKHLLFLLLTLAVVSFLVFTLNEFSPGAAARKILGAYATQDQVDILTKQMGLDRPVLVRYVEYVGKLLSGDLAVTRVRRTAAADQALAGQKALRERARGTRALAFAQVMGVMTDARSRYGAAELLARGPELLCAACDLERAVQTTAL